MQKISVIVPVYNTEKYIKKCLDSIINQTYSNIEIIIISNKFFLEYLYLNIS